MFRDNYQYFNGKTIVISGSSKGIGRVLARTLGLMGSRIVINGTNKADLDATHAALIEQGIDVVSVPGSVVDPDICAQLAEAAIQHFGGIDIVIANAGISSKGTVEETDPKVFRHIMDVNFLGTVYLVKACMAALKQSKGHILMTGSASGIRGIPNHAAYSASKMALTALADVLKIELCQTGVGVSIAYVGFTQNDENKKMLSANGEKVQNAKTARGKISTQQEVALRMIDMIGERKFKEIFSPLGVLNAAVLRIWPAFGSFMLKRHYLKGLRPVQHEISALEISRQL